jgi:cytochrome c-type biogenesis protein CcmH
MAITQGVFAALALSVVLTAQAATDAVVFADAAQDARYHVLIQELRCVVCQNQTLADSHAPLAKDLRAEVERLIKDGKDDAAILDFLLARYGDFVLYRPRLQQSTFLLWFGPLLFLALAWTVVWRWLRAKRAVPVDALSDDEKKRLAQLTQQSPLV